MEPASDGTATADPEASTDAEAPSPEDGVAPDEDGLAPDDETTAAEGRGTDRTQVIVGVALAAVAIGVIGVLIATGAGDRTPANQGGQDGVPIEGRATAVVGTLDEFDRPDTEDGLGQFTADREWQEFTGIWGIDNGDAYVADPDEFRNHAVIGLGQPDGAAEVRVDRVTAESGLVFRFKGPANYWAVVAAPAASTWNLLKVENTAGEFVENTGPSPVADGTTVAVRLAGDRIEVSINGQLKISVEDDFLADEAKVGLTTKGDDATKTRFDDFVAARPGNQPLFVGDGSGNESGGPATTGAGGDGG